MPQHISKKQKRQIGKKNRGSSHNTSHNTSSMDLKKRMGRKR